MNGHQILLLFRATLMSALLAAADVPSGAAQAAPPKKGQAPEFPAQLRRTQPVAAIEEAVVYTVNESTDSAYALDLARRSGSDVLIRGWFKWNRAPNVRQQTHYVEQAHAMGALFGGGITCSALYDGENGLTQDEWMNMVTRGTDGELVDAWGHAGIRHGSLSSPAYLDYLFRWCREQIDAGADYLFMDEINAALRGNEGFDDSSCRDFCRYLTTVHEPTRSWQPADQRWAGTFKVDVTDKTVCPDGTMASFTYRAYLSMVGANDAPHGEQNPLREAWHAFRDWRDNRAWRELTDRIRTYTAAKGRRVYLSGNGLAPYVDLQVLGVWGRWQTRDGHIDLSESQVETWRGVVRAGREMATRNVPVVFFHDWGFGTPPFPWLAVAPEERCIWMRTRGAEIYAAGGFFAFPVLGPFGCDAGKDGTICEIARQSAFYHRHNGLYLEGEYLGTRCLTSPTPEISLAAWRGRDTNELLVHVINRSFRNGRLEPRTNAVVFLPLTDTVTECDAVSPDWGGTQPVDVRVGQGDTRLTLPHLEAYVVARLRFGQPVDSRNLEDPPRACPPQRWQRPERGEFPVTKDGKIRHSADLNGFLQGALHTHLRNPPTFTVDPPHPIQLGVRVNSVASVGARLRCAVDGEEVGCVDFPDLDGKNDGAAREHARTVTFDIPSGHHRVLIENAGPDWLTVDWYEFKMSP